MRRPKGSAQTPKIPNVSAADKQPPVVVTLVYDRTTGAIAISPIFQTEANLLIHVLQGAVQQTVAMVAVESARLRGVTDQPPA